MDKAEARALLDRELQSYRTRSYDQLVALLRAQQIDVGELRGASGVVYQFEILVIWDDKPGGDVRVIGSIDDGGWRRYLPLGSDFIMAPDGSFVDEGT